MPDYAAIGTAAHVAAEKYAKDHDNVCIDSLCGVVYSRPMQKIDPLDNLRRCHRSRLQHEERLADLRVSERSRAVEAHDAGYSYAEIAKVLDLSRSRAQQLVEEGRANERP